LPDAPVNKNVVNIMTNDLAHAVLLTPKGMLEARKNQIYVIDLEFAEEPRAKARRRLVMTQFDTATTPKRRLNACATSSTSYTD
jgi:hypothetical protein